MGVFFLTQHHMSNDDAQNTPDSPTVTEGADSTSTNNNKEIQSRRIFVGNLSFRTNFKSLKEGFSKVGTVEKVNVISKEGRRLGFGFVHFADDESVQKAIDEMNGTELDGREIKVERSFATKRPAKKRKSGEAAQKPTAKKPKRPRRVRVPIEDREVSDDVVYVRNLAESANNETLTDLFKDFEVTSVSVHSSFRRKDGSKPKYAFVTVTSSEDQQKAVETLQGNEVDGLEIFVSKAFKKLPIPEPEPEAEAEAPATENAPAKKKKKPRRKPKKNVSDQESSDSSPKEGESIEEKPKKKKPRRKPKKPTKEENSAPESAENASEPAASPEPAAASEPATSE